MKQKINFRAIVPEQIHSISNELIWTSTIGTSMAVKKFEKVGKNTKYRNVAIARDGFGNNVFIVNFIVKTEDKNKAEINAMHDLLYYMLKYVNLKFSTGLDFHDIKNIDDEYIPSVVMDHVIKNISIKQYMMSRKLNILCQFYFYAYIK